MNWHYVLAGLVVTALASLMAFGIERAVPNYDDGEYIPRWITTWILGLPLSLLVGWWAA